MMHKWESQEKLLAKFEADQQVSSNNFDFKDFHYERDDFDNVPTVVPKFLLWLQHQVKPLYAWIKAELEMQTTASLKDEVQDWMKDLDGKIEVKEQAALERENKIID
jgi:hypothetical protein